jgi:hypothetical protein
MNENKQQNLVNCAACGLRARRASARFCAACGHDLREDYAPLDFLRASYNLRGEKLSRCDFAPVLAQTPTQKLFVENRNGASETAMACVVYSLVPYLGILFCPGAVLLGGIGLAVSFQKPQLGGRQTASNSIVLGFVVAGIQLLLWYLLYVIPELNG